MKNIAIFGDSFADPNIDNNYISWPELLKTKFSVTNFAQAGTGLWWSYKQFKKISSQYDLCIVVVSIPGRVHLEKLDNHMNFNSATWPTSRGVNLGNIYFEHFYSEEKEQCFQDFMVQDILKHNSVVVIPAFDESISAHTGKSLCYFADLESKHYSMFHATSNDKRKCHLTKENNLMIYNKILSAIDNQQIILNLDATDYNVPAEPAHFYWK
jgi:hypothetical protein